MSEPRTMRIRRRRNAASARRTAEPRHRSWRPLSWRRRIQNAIVTAGCMLAMHPQQLVDIGGNWTICPCGRRYYAP